MNSKIDQNSARLESLTDTRKTQDEMKLKIKEISASIRELKNVPETLKQLDSRIEQISTSVEELKDTPKIQEEMKSKLNVITASIEELNNTPKAVIAFRATCAKNFPNSYTTSKSENPGSGLLDCFFALNLVDLVHLSVYNPSNNKPSNNVQFKLFGRILNIILAMLLMKPKEPSLVHLMEFIHSMLLHLYGVQIWVIFVFMLMGQIRFNKKYPTVMVT